MKKVEALAPGEYEALVEDVRRGVNPEADEARQRLIVAFIPLAKTIAKKYEGKLGFELALSAAFFGLTMAMRTWNPEKGALPSWIRLYVKSALLRELDKATAVKMPQPFAAKHAMYQHYKKQGLNPAEKMELTDDEIKEHESVPTVSYLEDALHEAASLAKDHNEEAALLAEQLLSGLDQEDQAVLRARFGIGSDGLCHSYEETAGMLNKSVADVMASEARGLAKLKAAASSEG